MNGRRKPDTALGLTLAFALVLLALIGWAVGWVLTQVLERQVLAWIDLPITRYLADHRVGWLTATLRGLSLLGSTAVLLPLIVAAGGLGWVRRRSWGSAAFLVAAQLGAIVIYDIDKILVSRPRPAVGQLVATATGFSFPSGHSAQVVAVWGALALMVFPALQTKAAKIATGSAVVVLALLVGFSRVYLGVHWSTDVLGGWALGALWLAALALAVRRHATMQHSGGERHGAR